MLVIELDGGHHNESEKIEYDNYRTNYLESMGFKLLRFWNNEVLENLDGVLEKIRMEIESPSPKPSPGGRGL